MRDFRLFWLVACLLTPALVHCAAPEAVDPSVTSARVGEAGATLTLADGTAVEVEPGFLNREVEVSLEVLPISTPVGGEIGRERIDIRAVAPTVVVRLPADAVKVDAHRALRVRAPADETLRAAIGEALETMELMARIGIDRDGQEHLAFLHAYSLIPKPEARSYEMADEVAVSTERVLQSEALDGMLSISVQPIAFAESAPVEKAAGDVAPDGFVLEDVVTTPGQAIAFDWTPDGRLFIAEKAGVVRVFAHDTLHTEPFVDIQARVMNDSDRGLLSIAVHPQFPAQPYVYLFYVYDPKWNGAASERDRYQSTVALLSRFTADPATDHETALPNSEVVLVGGNGPANLGVTVGTSGERPACQNGSTFVENCIPTDMRYHNGGHLAFGADGSLFLSIGDGYENIFHANTARTQSLDSLSGKLIRVNALTGDGYTDNPFYDRQATPTVTSNVSKVYALGLRSPWRIAIQPGTGIPFIGDVGLDTWEEVNKGRGANFGWPCYEGQSGTSAVQPTFQQMNLSLCQALYSAAPSAVTPVTAAVHAYPHSGSGASVIGGDFYRGTSFPLDLRGAYFFADYTRNWIKYLTFDSAGAATVHDFMTGAFSPSMNTIVQLRSGPDTNMYFVSIGRRTITRMRYTGEANNVPTAVISATPTAGILPLNVAFSSSGSFDADGDPLSFAWTFGDGTTSTEANPSHTYTTAGTFNVTLTVRDGTPTGTASATTTIRAGNAPPVVTLAAPLDDQIFTIGDTVPLSGSATDLEDGTLSGTSLQWSGLIHHNTHVHFDAFHAQGGSAQLVYEDHDDNCHLEVCLTATDSAGLTDTECVDIFPRAIEVTFVTDPPGLDLIYNSQRIKTPFIAPVYVGSHRSIAAPDQGADPIYRFSAWSDQGTQVHEIVGPSGDATITAYFTATQSAVPGFSGQWTFEGDANDSVGTNHGVALGGASFATDDVRGSVLACNGVDGRVTIANTMPAAFSWSAWLRTTAASLTGANAYEGNGVIWSDVGGAANDFTLALLNNRFSEFEGAVNAGATGVTVLNDGAWHHVAATRAPGGSVRLYVDGQLDATGTAGSAVLAANPSVVFCANMVDNRYYNGKLDDVRLYPRELTASEVALLASELEGPPGQSGPIGHWSLDGNGLDDVATNHAVAPASATATFLATAGRGKTLSCDGTTTELRLANTVAPSFTWSAWIATRATGRTGTNSYDGNGLITADASGVASDFVLATLNDRVSFYDGSSNTSLTGARAINDGQWHHVLVTRDAAAARVSIYVDGALDAQGAGGSALLRANPNVSFCNIAQLSGRYFQGALDNVTLYERALTATEAQALFTAQAVANTAPAIVSPGARLNNAGTALSLQLQASDPDLNPLAFAATELPGGLTLNASTGLISGTPTAGVFNTTVSVSDGLATASATFKWIVQPSGVVGAWSFAGNVRDSAGTNHGTAVGSLGYGPDATRGQVLVCNGTNAAARVANTVTASFTFSAWVLSSTNSPTGTAAYQGSGLIWSDVAGSGADFTLAVLNNKLSFYDGRAANTGAGITGTKTLTNGAWHHVAVTRAAGGNITLYVDGVADGSRTAGTVTLNANANVYFGTNFLDKRWFRGSLDSVRQYNRALTAAEIQALYAAGTQLP